MNRSGILKGICISEKKGTAKTEVPEAVLIEGYGLDGDAHAGSWHRQVSLLSHECIEAFKKRGADVTRGAFGENLIIEGFNLRELPIESRILIGEAELRLTQRGKECHSHCAIYKAVGDCIMPREGVFAEVVRGGRIKTGDEVRLFDPEENRPYTAAVITLSDRASRGESEDKSGPAIEEELINRGYRVVERLLLPDDRKLLETQLIRLADSREVNLIMTTGGTGFSERDCTPEATYAVATRNAPGIAEAIRAGSMKITGRAMLSRGASVIRNKTLIINLPGSPKAVRESMAFIMDELIHGIGILTGRGGEN